MKFEYLIATKQDSLLGDRHLPSSYLLTLSTGHRFTLERLGEAGWELTTVVEDQYSYTWFFKRTLP